MDVASPSGAGAPLLRNMYSDDFLMNSYKVELCKRSDNHDWGKCCYAHPKEKSKRRDPRAYQYASLPCPDTMQGGACPRGDTCPFTHNVYEYWLHPERFKTQMCKKGAHCTRPLCFFAHKAEELRFPESNPDAPAAPCAAVLLPGAAPAPLLSLPMDDPTPAPHAAPSPAPPMTPAGFAPQLHAYLDLQHAQQEQQQRRAAALAARQRAVAQRRAALEQQRMALDLWLAQLQRQEAACAAAAALTTEAACVSLFDEPASPMSVAPRIPSDTSSICRFAFGAGGASDCGAALFAPGARGPLASDPGAAAPGLASLSLGPAAGRLGGAWGAAAPSAVGFGGNHFFGPAF